MLPRRVGARSGLRGGFLSLLTVLSVLAVSSGTFARSHHQHADAKSSESRSSESKAKEAAGEEPRYSDIVVDGNTGAVLHASEPDALRHPASLTKIMTLYLLFEQLEAGKLKLDSWLEVSEHAAVQSPTKPDPKSLGKTEAKSGPYALASAGSVPFTLASAKSETKADVKTEANKPDAKTPVSPAAPANTVAITLTSKSDPAASTTVQVPRWAPAGAAPAARPAPSVGSEDPIHPVPVHTVLVRPGAIQTASIAPLQPPADAPVATAAAASAPMAAAPAAPSTAASAITAKPLPFPPPGTRPGAIGGLPSSIATASVSSAPSADITPTPPTPAPPPATSAPATPHAATPPAHSGWMIQVGAFPAEEEAKQRLSSVQSRASRYLATADAFTESVTKGDSILYRARFAGLGKEQAEAACKYLKRNDVDCMTIKN